MPEALNTSVLRGPGSATVAGRVNVDGRTANTLKGLESFSQGLKDLGDFEKARKVNNDIITAKVAFSANKAMPGGLEPEAESFYNQAMAVTGTRKFLADFADREKVITGSVLGADNLVNISESGEELTFTGAYENQLELEFNAFKVGAGFNDAQNSDVTQILNEAMFQYKANFATAHAAQMKSERDANNKQFVNEEIRASLNIMREANIDNLSSNQVFTHSYHQGLFDRLSIMAPWMTRDEKDLMIIEGFADIASDNSNPDADMMDYLSEPRPDGQPRFSDIPTLRKAVLAGQTAAISKFNTVHSAEIAAEKYQEELRQTDLRERFNNRLMKNLNGPPGERLSLKTWLTAMQEAGVESKTQNFIKGLYDAALSEARTDPESQAAIAGLKDAVDNMEFKKEDDLVRDPRFKDLTKEDQVALRKLFVDNAAGKVSKQLTANQATLKEQYQVYLKSILEINGENYTIRTDDLGTPINVSSTYLMAANFIRDKLSDKLRAGYELAKKEDRLLDWEATIKPKILSDVMEHYLGDKLRAIGVKGMMGGGRHLPDPEQNKLDQEAYRPPMPLVSVGKSAPTNTLSSHTVASQNPQNLPGRWTDVNNGERVALHHIKEIQDALNKYPEGSLGEFTSLADIALIRILKKAGSGIATFGQNIVNSFTSDSPIDLETIEVTPENSTGGKPKEELVGKGKWEFLRTPKEQELIDLAGYERRRLEEGQKIFDPEGLGYDYKAAKNAGMERDSTGHMGSVAPVSKEDREKFSLPDNSYIILKGKKHETFDKAVKAEEDRGSKVIKLGSRYYSVPKGFKPGNEESPFAQPGEGVVDVGDKKEITIVDGKRNRGVLVNGKTEFDNIGNGSSGSYADPAIERALRRSKVSNEELSGGLQKVFKGQPYVAVEHRGEKRGKDRIIKNVGDLVAGKVDIAFGHKLTADDISSGKIYGIPFIKDGKIIPLTTQEETTIFEKDFAKAADSAEKIINSPIKFRTPGSGVEETIDVGKKFNTFPTSLQDFLADIVFNIGAGSQRTGDHDRGTGFHKYVGTFKALKALVDGPADMIKVNKFMKEVRDRQKAQGRSDRLLKEFGVKEDLINFFKVKQ
jgi:hypothetical protein